MAKMSTLSGTAVCTVFALFAFAGNSIFCRLALGNEAIDAAGFTVIRLLSGIVVLALIPGALGSPGRRSTGSWSASVYLFTYAVCFSFGYLSLDTGIGALILFASVQITMIVAGIVQGDRPAPMEWLGMAATFSGFTYLVSAGLERPPLGGAALMTAAGMAWGVYTLAGRRSASPLQDTTFNFIRTLPLLLPLLFLAHGELMLSPGGVLLAMLSGGLASGVGYALWYAALGGLSALQAAVLQLLVPVIAALGGVLFMGEALTLRLLVAATIILGGILTVLLGRQRSSPEAAR